MTNLNVSRQKAVITNWIESCLKNRLTDKNKEFKQRSRDDVDAGADAKMFSDCCVLGPIVHMN